MLFVEAHLGLIPIIAVGMLSETYHTYLGSPNSHWLDRSPPG